MVDARSALHAERPGDDPVVRPSRRRWLVGLAYVTAVFPWLLAIVRALTDGWSAMADNALIATRALDVLSVDHHPLVGTLSSVSASTATTVHHPGPLLFDVLALPSRLFGPNLGIPLAVGTLNALCACWFVAIAGRVGGLAARMVAAVVVVLLAWTMTWPLMVEPWNPHVAMVPALLFFVSCGALTLGEPVAALPAVVSGSLCLQIHLGYVYIVGLTVLVTLGLWWANRRSTSNPPRRWRARDVLVPLAVLTALWIQPILDLLINGGDSNVVAMLRAAGSSTPTVSGGDAIRLVAAVIALPPWWLPGGFEELSVIDPPPPLSAGVLGLVVLVAVWSLVAWRAPSQSLRAFGRYLALLVPSAVVAMTRVPLHPNFGFNRDHWRWLWVLGLLMTFVAGWTIVALLRRSMREVTAMATAAAAAACLAVVAATVVGHDRPGPIEYAERAAVRGLVDDLPFDELGRCARVLVDFEPGFAPPALVAPAVMLAIRQRGIDFAPSADDARLQLDRDPHGDEECTLSLDDRPGPGRVIGELDDPLRLTVTFVGPDP